MLIINMSLSLRFVNSPGFSPESQVLGPPLNQKLYLINNMGVNNFFNEKLFGKNQFSQ